MIRRLIIKDAQRCVGCQSCMFACTRREGKVSLEGQRIHVKSIGGVARGFTVIVCRACEEPSCFYACTFDALQKRESGGVRLVPDKCTGCGKCADACPFSAITLDRETGKPLICLYCGYCKDYCAYGVLDVENI